MMKEFDAQTQRVSERVSRQINEERTIIQEKMHGVLMPKIIQIFRDYNMYDLNLNFCYKNSQVN